MVPELRALSITRRKLRQTFANDSLIAGYCVQHRLCIATCAALRLQSLRKLSYALPWAESACFHIPLNRVNGRNLSGGRFVRETGYRTVEAICVVCVGEALRDIGPELAERLADGLSDSWSHVRFHLI